MAWFSGLGISCGISYHRSDVGTLTRDGVEDFIVGQVCLSKKPCFRRRHSRQGTGFQVTQIGVETSAFFGTV